MTANYYRGWQLWGAFYKIIANFSLHCVFDVITELIPGSILVLTLFPYLLSW